MQIMLSKCIRTVTIKKLSTKEEIFVKKNESSGFTDVKQLKVESIDKPVIKSDEVLVKIKSCALCTWDSVLPVWIECSFHLLVDMRNLA